MARGTLLLRTPFQAHFPALQAELVTLPPPGLPVPLSHYHVVSLLSLFGDFKNIYIHAGCAE